MTVLAESVAAEFGRITDALGDKLTKDAEDLEWRSRPIRATRCSKRETRLIGQIRLESWVGHEGAGVERHRKMYEAQYDSELERWMFHDTKDPLVRYLRDRRIKIGVQRAMKVSGSTPQEWNALVVCGGVGGEGTLLVDLGFRSVTVSDFSENALEICQVRDPRLKTEVVNSEAIRFPDSSFDLVLVQDGLHHLPRPMLGYTEMLRVARRAVIVIEPHAGLVAKLIGTTWEKHGEEVNYVFRWNQLMLEGPARSLLLESPTDVHAIRTWDHNVTVHKLIRKLRLGSGGLAVLAAKSVYAALNIPFSWLGNMMIGVVVKMETETERQVERSAE